MLARCIWKRASPQNEKYQTGRAPAPSTAHLPCSEPPAASQKPKPINSCTSLADVLPIIINDHSNRWPRAHEKHPKCNCHWNIMEYQSVLVHISNPGQNCNSSITLHTISYHDLLRAECVWSFNPLTIYSLASIAPNLETWFAILLQVLHGSNFQFACYWLRFARVRNP